MNGVIIIFALGIVLIAAKPTNGQNETYFDSQNSPEVKGYFMKTTTLNCRITNLGLKTVTWIRSRDDHIISIGSYIFSTDNRFKVHLNISETSEDYMLNIKSSKLEDAGSYQCVVLAEQKLILSVYVSIIEDVSDVVFCSDSKIQCIKGHCIPLDYICDAGIDCADGWDEMFCQNGKEKRICHLRGCSHVCYIDNGIARCLCPDDSLELDVDQKTCININECLSENGGCSQLCIDTPISYNCSCFEGYSLSKDGHKCEKDGPDPNFFYSTPESINSFAVHFRRHYTFLNASAYVVGIAYQVESNTIFLADKDVHSSQGKMYSVSVGKEQDRFVYSSAIKCPEDVQVDRLTSMIYVADMFSSKIDVFVMNETEESLFSVSTMRNSLIRKPVALALDAKNSTIYWADWGHNLGIQRSAMDGTKPEVLINTSISKPKALVLDETSQRLFWTDFELGVIESVNTDGNGRKIILESVVGFKPYALTVLEDRIYFSNWTSKSVMACSKLQCDHTNIEYLFTANDIITDLNF